MAGRLIRPKQFTQKEVERKLDQLALRYYETHDKKVMREIERLSRVLGKLSNKLEDLLERKLVQVGPAAHHPTGSASHSKRKTA
jgi:hypothetical protein